MAVANRRGIELVEFNKPKHIGHFYYKEAEYLKNGRANNIVPTTNHEGLARYLVDYSNSKIRDEVNLIQNFYLINFINIFDNFTFSTEPKQVHFFQWIAEHKGSSRNQITIMDESNTAEYEIDFIIRRKMFSELLLAAYKSSYKRVKKVAIKFHNTLFLTDSITEDGNYHQTTKDHRPSYAGMMFEQFISSYSGLPIDFGTVNYNTTMNEDNYMSVDYREITCRNNSHKLLLTVNADCLYNKNNNIHCEIKSHYLPQEKIYPFKDTIKKWWVGGDKWKIEFLKLGDLKNKSDRISVLNTLLSEKIIKEYWAQCLANDSNKVILGLHLIEDDHGRNTRFALNTVLEIEFEHLVEFLLYINFSIDACYAKVNNVLSKLKEVCKCDDSVDESVYIFTLDKDAISIQPINVKEELIPNWFKNDFYNE